jgi:hypothetical protein
MANVEGRKSLGEKLLSIKRQTLFVILFAVTTIPHFFPTTIPNRPRDEAIDLYRHLMALGPESRVIVQSDWTESTRGESRGQMDALLRILMRREVKFALMSMGDPQAIQVARDVVTTINQERIANDQAPYRRWEDWISLGYFPNAEGTGNAIAANIRDAFRGRRDVGPGGNMTDVFQSPVLGPIQRVEDLDMYIVNTGSKTIIISLERLSRRVRMAGLVTGVMGPETLNYYISGQLIGLSAGLKGVYDLETLMQNGFTGTLERGEQVTVPGFPGDINLDKGTRYILTLHAAIGLLILAVIVGNIGVALTRRRGA